MVMTVHQPASSELSFEGLASDFLGQWRARRFIVDHLARRSFIFFGIATLAPDHFLEEGEMSLGSRTLPGRRFYRLEINGDEICVRFEDGRHFFRLDGRARQKFVHVCGEDVYRGQILVAGPSRFLEFWRVSGPRKRYASLTRFTRLPNDCLAIKPVAAG